jgi:hypothetical protein
MEKFIKRFKINQLLRSSNATKDKGFPAHDVFAFLLGLVFSGKNFYNLQATAKEMVPFGKDAVYRFLNNASINWGMFLYRLSISVVRDVDKLTSKDRRTALIIDDTPYKRDRSKKVELLSRFKDHAENRYYKGFNLLNMGWSDGETFLPVQYRILANADDEKLVSGLRVKKDRRTIATRIRDDARKDKPSLVLEMLSSVKGTPAEARYVLFDSWFASPSSILSVKGMGYHVCARLKNHPNYRYLYCGGHLSIGEIYAKHKKRRGRSRHLLSVVIGVRHNGFDETVPAKLVYVRDRNKPGNWIAIMTTDMGLSEDEIIALYGKRWDIEPFHKVIKSVLKLENEFQSRSFDSINAHTAVTMTRYLFLALEKRENKDFRSINEGFYYLCDELDDISFAFAFEMILSALKQCVSEYLYLDKEHLAAAVDYFLASLPDFIKGKLKFSMCES